MTADQAYRKAFTHEQAFAELEKAGTADAIDTIRVRYLGRKGVLTGLMRNISQLPKEDRPFAGKKANQVKGILEKALKEALHRLEAHLHHRLVGGAARLASDDERLLVARDDTGHIVGSLTLAMFRIPTGLRAWIEDVVVDQAARGQGIGALLNEAAIDRARAYLDAGVDGIMFVGAKTEAHIEAIGRAPMVNTSRRMPPTPVAAP